MCTGGGGRTEKENALGAMQYRKAMLKLRQHADFTDDDIAEFQHDFDLFFRDWVELYGKNRLTNYVHLLSSGHISEYLCK